jgi:hypothetical protein
VSTARPVSSGYRAFFLIAAIYDYVLGIAFFFFYRPIFEALDIALPNNTSYIHITAAFVFVQGIGYWFVYQDPRANVGIVKLGVVYKFVYSALALYYLAIGQLLHSVFLVFGALDVLFLIGFVFFLRDVYQPRPAR